MLKRIKKAQGQLVKQGLDVAILKDPANIFYLSNFYGSFTGAVAYLVLPAIGKPVLLTDFRYIEEAQRDCIASILITKIHSKVYLEVREIVDSLTKKGVLNIGFEGAKVTWADANKLKAAFKGLRSHHRSSVKFVDISGSIEKLRTIKDAGELELMTVGQKMADKALKKFLKSVKPGLTERYLAAELELIIKRDLGLEPSFEIVMASGPNSSMPHARVTDRRVRRGDLLKVDFGVRHQGYSTDMTRTVTVGKAAKRAKEIYKIVLNAQLAALSALKAGQKCSFIDKIARDHIAACGYPDNFGHNLGHGAGIDVHESPTLGARSVDELQENMVVTVEPGIYIPGFGGVRIEDLVVVKKGGLVNLTSFPKELIEL